MDLAERGLLLTTFAYLSDLDFLCTVQFLCYEVQEYLKGSDFYLLFFLIQVHEPIRSDILEQVLNRVLTKAASPVSHFIGNTKEREMCSALWTVTTQLLKTHYRITELGLNWMGPLKVI